MEAKNRLGALTGLRCVAAAAVAVAHLPGLLSLPGLGPTSARLLTEGFYGLTTFFVLSGFILAYTYHDRLARPTRRELGRYALARVARVWPLHLLTLGLAAVLATAPAPGGVGTAVANAFLVHAWVPDIALIQSYNSVSWTLSHEAFFYA